MLCYNVCAMIASQPLKHSEGIIKPCQQAISALTVPSQLYFKPACLVLLDMTHSWAFFDSPVRDCQRLNGCLRWQEVYIIAAKHMSKTNKSDVGIQCHAMHQSTMYCKQSKLGADSSCGALNILQDCFAPPMRLPLQTNAPESLPADHCRHSSNQSSGIAYVPGLTFGCVHAGSSCKWLPAAHSGGHHSAEDSGQRASPRASLHLGVCTSALHTFIMHHCDQIQAKHCESKGV